MFGKKLNEMMLWMEDNYLTTQSRYRGFYLRVSSINIFVLFVPNLIRAESNTFAGYYNLHHVVLV